MKKRSTILLLALTLFSFGLLLMASYSTTAEAIEKKPAKCSVPCNKIAPSPLPWNMLAPAMFPNQG